MRPHPIRCESTVSRRSLLWLGLASATLVACAGPGVAVAGLVDVDVIDRDTGQALAVYHHHGRRYVAGRPGARYAIRITNRSGGRLLAVTAVDGVNIVSGQTASWAQTGYVFAPWQSYELTGWRKSDRQVAAFEFTALPDSYAARTGRPLDVGVIGVAVFRERPPAVVRAPSWNEDEGRGDRPEAGRQGDARGAAAPSADSLGKAAAESQAAEHDRLGTGHGAHESSRVSRTEFERASTTPAQIVSIQYDRYENLVAAGIVPGPRYGGPRPFPGSRDNAAYVPDPPTD